jgi:hypothetical protein
VRIHRISIAGILDERFDAVSQVMPGLDTQRPGFGNSVSLQGDDGALSHTRLHRRAFLFLVHGLALNHRDVRSIGGRYGMGQSINYARKHSDSGFAMRTKVLASLFGHSSKFIEKLLLLR